MFSRLLIVALMFSALIAQSAQARDLTEAEKLADFRQLTALVRSSYGPLQYKQQQRNISIDLLEARYEQKVRNTSSNGEFYYLINQFVAEFKDSHFRARVPGTHQAVLGFFTDLVEGAVVIDEIDRKILPESEFPFARGDEIVSLNGKAAIDVARENSSYAGAGSETTALRIGAMQVSARMASILPVPSGEVVVAIRPRLQSWIIKEVTLKWISQGEPLDEQADEVESHRPFSVREFQLSVQPLYDELFAGRAEKSFRCSGATRITVPADATMVLEKPFVAYYHPTERGNVGYLRIPHYYPVNEVTGEDEFDLRLEQYKYALSVLESNTVGLVIDQDHNCGGSVGWLEAMVGLFMGADYQPMQFQFLASKGEYLIFQGWQSTSNPNTLEYVNFQKVVDLIKTSWRAGQFLTSKTSFSGLESLRPDQIYTKPVVMLIDELSGSGGDAFPALMKGFGRAKLIGTKTMGAGGHVMNAGPLNYSGIKLSLTKSLFFHPDGSPVENNGAEPDYPYTISREDYANGYHLYQKFYLQKLFEQLGH